MTEPSASYPELAGKVAVVTGAARGMGARFAQGLVSRGVNVVGGDINAEGMRATADAVNRETDGNAALVAAQIDVTIADEHTRLADIALERFGQVDYWINNAGVFPQGAVLEIPAEQMRSTFAVNVDGVLFGTQAAARAIGDRGGSVVNMSSVSAFRVRPTRAVYSASKAAVDHLTRFLSLELGTTGLRVNAIAPGFIDTEMTAWLHDQPGLLEKAVASVPLGRIGTTDDIFAAVLFLLSDSASYISGSTIFVDGGSRNFSASA
ncbi:MULTISPECIES: SDR family NAD(P)-dependent oxidoreductase [Microbacterium]|uniref:3-oxoacyl-[acyl-carrier protein] reductase n=1 Tax=Microbacterium saccharophilum TaxID=1213358 RepID=A0A7Z7CYL6_9MICO|nr:MULTISPECIES: SDR family oxidoreductase [Microbacterium]SFI61089.1 3-oxoacyl-[acyl-carrier protein] reductase [Microbacterium saccharophilum]